MNGPYPIHKLPELPEELLQGGSNKAAENCYSNLSNLGFERIFRHRYVSLETRLKEAWRLLEHKEKYKELPPPQKLLESICEFWRHPGGLIATAEFYKNTSRSHDGSLSVVMDEPDPNEGDWHLSSSLNALEIVGVTENVSLGSAYEFTRSGIGIKRQYLRFSPSYNIEDWKRDWKKIQNSMETGHSLPICEWGDVVEGLSFLNQFENNLPLENLKPSNLKNPTARYELASKISRKHIASSSKEILSNINMFPVSEDEKSFYKRELGKRALTHLSDIGKASVGVPGWIKKEIGNSNTTYFKKKKKEDYNRSLLSSVLMDFEIGEPLNQKEREITAFWISVLGDPRHPSLQKNLKKAFELSLDRFGIKFQHLLFKGMNHQSYAVGSYIKKLLWWQSQLSENEKKQMSVHPDADGKTLPMRWVETMYAVQDEAYKERRRNQRVAASQRALADLLKVVDPQDVVFVTDRKSVWDNSLVRSFYTETDIDLLEPHKSALVDTVGWFKLNNIDIPDSIFVFGNNENIKILDRDGLVQALENSISSHPDKWRTKDAKLHMEVIEYISAMLLEDILNKKSGPATGSKRKLIRL